MNSRTTPRRTDHGAGRRSSPRGDALGAYVLERMEEAGLRIAVRRLDPGGSVYARGDEDRDLFVVVRGLVRVHKPYGSFREATVGLVGEGGVFGEPTLRAGGSHRDSAAALTPCRVARVSKDALARHLGRDPGCAPALLGAFGEWAERRERAIARLVPREVRSRLAALLLELADGLGEEATGGVAIRARLTHQQLADMVACTREAVSKEISALRRDGLIGVHGRPRLIVLRDRLGLGEAAQEGDRRNALGSATLAPA